MMSEPKTLREAIQYFSDPENCRKFMVFVRWPDGIVRCPRCGKENPAYLSNAKLYFCSAKHEKPKFSLKVGTIFEDSAIGLEKWLPAAWLIGGCKNGISSYEMARALGVTQKSAWFMLHRLREAMRDERTHKFGFGGAVESDEAFIGPNPQKMNRTQRKKYAIDRNKGEMIAKTPVHGMLDRELRQVRAKVVSVPSRRILQKAILDNVTPFGKVYTDEARAYDGLERNYIHEVINHSQECVRGQVHTNGLENFWSLLKRTLRGTYVAVEPFHPDAYLDEQVFRYNNRATKDNPLNDADRFAVLMTQVVGRRLTYAKLTGKEELRAE
jgi:transposase-like protein